MHALIAYNLVNPVNPRGYPKFQKSDSLHDPFKNSIAFLKLSSVQVSWVYAISKYWRYHSLYLCLLSIGLFDHGSDSPVLECDCSWVVVVLESADTLNLY